MVVYDSKHAVPQSHSESEVESELQLEVEDSTSDFSLKFETGAAGTVAV